MIYIAIYREPSKIKALKHKFLYYIFSIQEKRCGFCK